MQKCKMTDWENTRAHGFLYVGIRKCLYHWEIDMKSLLVNHPKDQMNLKLIAKRFTLNPHLFCCQFISFFSHFTPSILERFNSLVELLHI